MAEIRLAHISRSFFQGVNHKDFISVLKDITIDIEKGQSVALVGFSGSGKTTLLQILGLLDTPTSGDLWLKGQYCNHFSDHQKTLFRRHHLGFIYQAHYLLNEFNSLENVVLPQLIKGIYRTEAIKQAKKILEELGMEHRFKHRPAELSGGEQQRVAIARALVNNPSIILADEPTGNLDPLTALDVFQQLIDRVKQQHNIVLMATHNIDLAYKMDRIFHLENGMIKEGASHGISVF